MILVKNHRRLQAEYKRIKEESVLSEEQVTLTEQQSDYTRGALERMRKLVSFPILHALLLNWQRRDIEGRKKPISVCYRVFGGDER